MAGKPESKGPLPKSQMGSEKRMIIPSRALIGESFWEEVVSGLALWGTWNHRNADVEGACVWGGFIQSPSFPCGDPRPRRGPACFTEVVQPAGAG